jgi:hypothetical protein
MSARASVVSHAVALLVLTACNKPSVSSGPNDAAQPRATTATSLPSSTSPLPLAQRAPVAPADDDPVQPLCGTPAERELRAAFPSLVPCGNRAMTYARFDVNGHSVVVVAYDQDPCCTDVPTPAFGAGSSVFVDGAAYVPAQHGYQPFWTSLGALRGLAPRLTQTVLQAALMTRSGATTQIVTAREAEALRARWPASRGALLAAPPGVDTRAGGFHVRVWTEARAAERGISCHSLTAHEATLSAEGQLTMQDGPSYAEGNAMGVPCGAPLP